MPSRLRQLGMRLPPAQSSARAPIPGCRRTCFRIVVATGKPAPELGRCGVVNSRSQPDFERFYEAEKDRCLRAFTASTGSRELAEELIAEAFARAFARWPAVSRHPAPAACVMRVAYNLNVSWWRRRRREVPLDLAFEGAWVDDAAGPESTALLATLPERQRQVLALRVFLDLDTRQTADVLGIAEGTVTAHLYRATSDVRRRLAAETTERI